MKVFTQYQCDDNMYYCYKLEVAIKRCLDGLCHKVYATTHVDSSWWHGEPTRVLDEVLSRGVIFER